MDQENAANDTTAAVQEEKAGASCEKIAEAGSESAAVSEDASIEEPGSFEKMGLDKKLLRAIGDMGFDSATPIQEKAIPIELSGRDMIGQAQTGTGKTAAFGLPLLMRIDSKLKKLQADPRTCHSGVR